tara:strand:+ start:352 stop:618 length:267 start_codon:yes stop_codon:yes gene_type:complete
MSNNEINYEAKAAYNDLDTIKYMIGKEMDAHDIEANKNPNHFDSPSNRSRWKNLEEVYDRTCDLMDVINVAENDTCCSSEDDDCETPC